MIPRLDNAGSFTRRGVRRHSGDKLGDVEGVASETCRDCLPVRRRGIDVLDVRVDRHSPRDVLLDVRVSNSVRLSRLPARNSEAIRNDALTGIALGIVALLQFFIAGFAALAVALMRWRSPVAVGRIAIVSMVASLPLILYFMR